jgi:hypothetical protein
MNPEYGFCVSIKVRAPFEKAAELALNLAATEKIVLLAAPAIRALETADEQNRHAHSYKDGQHIRIRNEPMDHAMHKRQIHTPRQTHAVSVVTQLDDHS